ncbi:MAG: hypothetical protein AB1461_12325 [Thermodesulfobacteriota bacterium]
MFLAGIQWLCDPAVFTDTVAGPARRSRGLSPAGIVVLAAKLSNPAWLLKIESTTLQKSSLSLQETGGSSGRPMPDENGTKERRLIFLADSIRIVSTTDCRKKKIGFVPENRRWHACPRKITQLAGSAYLPGERTSSNTVLTQLFPIMQLSELW